MVLPPTQNQTNDPIAQAISATVNIINTPPLVNAPSVPDVVVDGSKSPPLESKPADPKPTDAKPGDEKKDDKTATVVAKDTGAKKDEPVKKLYCN